MKLISNSLLIGMSILIALVGCKPDKNSPEAILKKVDAMRAMSIANDWKWSKPEIKSHVTARNVVFKLSESKLKKVPLPKDKMLVAVAPYINQTHE